MKNKTRAQKAAAYRASAKQGEVLTLTDAMPIGSFAGGIIKDVIEHNPFIMMRHFRSKAVLIDSTTERYLRKVYNAKKNGRSWS